MLPHPRPMRPLVAVRRAVPFDPQFVTRDARFWPLTRAANALCFRADFPPIETLAKVFDGDPPVRFVAATPRRRRGAPLDARALYDARITLDRAVPTRPRCWHDLMNALVWGAFPLAKRALHARQYRAVARRLAPGARRLPPSRTPEQDALALLDEGGVVLVPPDVDIDASSAREVIVFGHAIYESLALGVAPAVVAGIALTVRLGQKAPPPGRHSDGPYTVLQVIDRALAEAIEDDTRLRSPRELKRVRISAVGTTA
jgi:hypothetical protein